MGAAAAVADVERGVVPVVRACYDVLDTAPLCGVSDFTDGKYLDDQNDQAAYLAAQYRQAEYLLDQVQCGPGTRLLDVGCGYGRILEHAARRGATPIGITISPPQVADCMARGLAVYELNYRDIFRPERGESWDAAFDAIVANGSLEHFVQASDAAAGRSDTIYREMFAICRRLLAPGGRLVTTAIHFQAARQFDPSRIVRGPGALPHGSSERRFARLVEAFGGWYPEPGQLQRCAAGSFALIAEEDGTHDYHLTSEYWVRRLRRSLATSPRVWIAVGRQLRARPLAALAMLRLHLWDQAWCWQFRDPAPMRLLRQTWLAK